MPLVGKHLLHLEGAEAPSDPGVHILLAFLRVACPIVHIGRSQAKAGHGARSGEVGREVDGLVEESCRGHFWGFGTSPVLGETAELN